MIPHEFSEASPGRLVAIQTPRSDWAFIPSALPPDWPFPVSLWPLLAEAKERLGTLNGIGQAIPSSQLLLRPLQRREAIISSRMEGTVVTPQELLLFELEPLKQDAIDQNTSNWREVHNYTKALERGREMLRTMPICLRLIRELHQILLQGVAGQVATPGEFRRWQVQLGSRARFIPPPPEQVEGLMNDLERYINEETSEWDPLVRAFLIHYQFETIHPFPDGNGRVGRVLLALMIAHWLGHSHAWLYLSAYFERFKEEYVSGLFHISTQGQWSDWIELCLRATITQANDSITRWSSFSAA